MWVKVREGYRSKLVVVAAAAVVVVVHSPLFTLLYCH
jgi:hypothetical protein